MILICWPENKKPCTYKYTIYIEGGNIYRVNNYIELKDGFIKFNYGKEIIKTNNFSISECKNNIK